MTRLLGLLSVAMLSGTLLGACSGSSSSSSSPPAADAATKQSITVPAAPPAALVGTELAEVNGQPVGTQAFDVFAQRQRPEGDAYTMDEKKAILGEAITDEVLFQEAFRQAMYHDPKVRKILVNLLLRAEVYGTVRNSDFSEAELKAYFEEHKEDFVIPEKVQVKRIFVAVKNDRPTDAAKQLADDLHARVKTDPDGFREIALEASDGPFKRRGGDLGYLSRDGKPGIPSEITSRAFQMEVGEVSEPFLAANGYNILFVANKRERIDRTYEQMRGSVLRRLKNEKYEELSEAFIQGLEDGAEITIDEAALATYSPNATQRPSLPTEGLGSRPGDADIAPSVVPQPGGGNVPAERPPLPEDPEDDDANDAARRLMMEDELEE